MVAADHLSNFHLPNLPYVRKRRVLPISRSGRADGLVVPTLLSK